MTCRLEIFQTTGITFGSADAFYKIVPLTKYYWFKKNTTSRIGMSLPCPIRLACVCVLMLTISYSCYARKKVFRHRGCVLNYNLEQQISIERVKTTSISNESIIVQRRKFASI